MVRTSLKRSVCGFIALSLTLLAPLTGAQTTYSEAPMLAERVTAGELPPVAERLPENPLVVEPFERVGSYGGEWNTVLLGSADHSWFRLTIAYTQLVRWNPEWTEVIPDVLESFEANEDATEYTFHMRKGLRWSDGAPFTADDIMFWYKDVYMNDALTLPEERGDNPVTVRKLDDTTVVFSFAEPNGGYLQSLATTSGADILDRSPAHYLKQFHKKYNPNADALAQEAGLGDWTDLFWLMAGRDEHFRNPDLPVLNGWMFKTAYGDAQRVVAERNPYFFKVDPEGNQLPYIDRVVYEVVEDPEVILLKALNGELDMQNRHIDDLVNKPVLFDNQEASDYHFWETYPEAMNTMVVALNLTHQDPVKREVFNNKDFRIGLSHAINRSEIIDLVFVSQGEPWQAAPRPESEYYDDTFAKQYTDYDLDRANAHLDRVLPERDAQGFRVGPDGKRLSFAVEVSAGEPYQIDILERIRDYWREVGVDMRVRVVERSYLYERRDANQQDGMVWGGEGGLRPDLDARWYVPSNHFAIGWETWFDAPEDPLAVEPPEVVKRQEELMMAFDRAATDEERTELMKRVLEVAKEQFWVMGISLPTNGFGIVKNNFHNVPPAMPGAWSYPTPAPTNPEQYFIEDGAQSRAP